MLCWVVVLYCGVVCCLGCDVCVSDVCVVVFGLLVLFLCGVLVCVVLFCYVWVVAILIC